MYSIKIFFILLLSISATCFSTSAYAQTAEDLKGRWEGVHYYGDTTRLYNGTLIVRASTIDSMKMILTIDQLQEGKFTGSLHEHFYADPKGSYFKAAVSGFVRNDSIHFNAFEIKENRLPQGNRWCKPKATGILVKHETFFALNMSFESTLTCTVGPAILERDIVENTAKIVRLPEAEKITPDRSEVRAVSSKKTDSLLITEKFQSRNKLVITTINVVADYIRIKFVDNGTVDGDSIAVFINGNLEKAHIRLSTTPFTMNLQFEAGQDEIEVAMFAENLGTIPPNTALMQILDGTRLHQAYLSSDTTSNAVIRIRKPK